MRPARAPFAVAALIGLLGCADAHGFTGPDGLEYGPSLQLAGVMTSGFEVEAVVLCGKGREDCMTGAARREDGACWMTYTAKGAEDLQKLSGGTVYAKYDYRDYWIEFTGRRTVAPGRHGHLGVYECQVLVESMTRFEELAGRDD